MSPLDPDERALLDAILADPDDDALRLVYADWLEERGDVRADYLRTEVEYRRCSTRKRRRLDELQSTLRRLRVVIDQGWIARVARVPIENCRQQASRLDFDYECPLRWEELAETSIATERHCGRCDQIVYHCGSMEKAREHAGAGHCVAVDTSLARFTPSHDLQSTSRLMGRILPVPHHPDRRIKPIATGGAQDDATTDD